MCDANFDKIVIISGPSGAGEDSIIEKLAEKIKINRVITSTTRKMRDGESEGKPYHFISKKEFEEKMASGEMLEWARQYNGELYGVSCDEIKRVCSLEGLGVWKIEYQGVIKMKEKFSNLLAVLVKAESLEVLERRIRKRDKSINEEYLKERMLYSKKWLEHEDIYDYVIVNKEGKLHEAVEELYEYLLKEKSEYIIEKN